MFCTIKAHKTSFEEVVFWAGEIYYSGFIDSLWEHVWKIYYDFYAITYPKYEKKINKLSKNPDSFKNIVYTLNLFYYSKPTYEVFALRMLKPKAPTHIYMGRTPKWLKSLDLAKAESKLIRSLHNRKKANVVFYINQITDNQKCYNSIKKYYTEIHGLTLKPKTLHSITYKNKTHILLALICHLSLDIDDIQTKTIFKKLNETIVVEQFKFNSDTTEPLYKRLSCKRLYKISPLVGAFKLDRFSMDKINHKDMLRLYWDYFTFHTPLWYERIKNCSGVINDTTYELIFRNDIDHETFYESYNYEPDEQSIEVQNKSICDIDIDVGKKWLITVIPIYGNKQHLLSDNY
jgi:hypothetical protein